VVGVDAEQGASLATTSASVGSVWPGRRTRILLASAMTWALVRISPSSDTTTPVPTASPFTPPLEMSALMVTTDGPTASATALTSSPAGVDRSGSPELRSLSSAPIHPPASAPSNTTASAVPTANGQRPVLGRAAGRNGGRGGTPGAGGGSAEPTMVNVYRQQAVLNHSARSLTCDLVSWPGS
jgi:hypothetical protein